MGFEKIALGSDSSLEAITIWDLGAITILLCKGGGNYLGACRVGDLLFNFLNSKKK